MSCGHGGGSFNQINNAIRPGARKVFCVKFQKEMEGLDEIPFEGHPLGQKIYDSVSKEAWKMWVEHMKMLMNEYRLNLGTSQAQEFLLQQMDKYFFGEGAQLPPDFVARLKRRAEASPARSQSESQSRMRAPQCRFHFLRRLAAREKESQVARSFGQRNQPLPFLSR